MIDRRDLLKAGAGAPLALAIPTVLHAATRSVALWVTDDRFDGHATAMSRTVRLADGDVTPLWVGTLDDAWRGRGFVVAGLTGEDSLFVIEQLAWHRGRRVVERLDVIARTADRPALVRWRVAPVHRNVTV